MTTPNVPHRFEYELTVSGTPEVVWDAIASAAGISSWMMPTQLDPRVGGALTFDMGPDAQSHGKVTAFEPGRRVEYEEYWDALLGREGADVTPLVTEFLIEARAGGTCVVRVVTSAFGTGADWENEFFEEMGLGWAPMLDNLRLYLAHFPGQTATTLFVSTTSASTPEALIAAVRDELSVAAVGDAVDARGVVGQLERTIDHHILIRVEQPVGGMLSFFAFDGGNGSTLQVQGYLFSEDAADYVAREQAAWQEWLERVAAGASTSSVRA